ncbi:MAG: SAM-dependent methyltransferase, partial [Gammaproteobacteria bacterium]
MPYTPWSWSHSLKNYVLMFDLTTAEFCQPILDMAAGPSSFNCEMKRQGYKVVSADPLYATAPEMIEIVTTNLVNSLCTEIKANPD